MEENRRRHPSSVIGTAPSDNESTAVTDSSSVSTNEYTTESFVTRPTFDGETAGDYNNRFDEDSSSSSSSSDGNALCESASTVLTAETYGIGVNRNVRFNFERYTLSYRRPVVVLDWWPVAPKPG